MLQLLLWSVLAVLGGVAAILGGLLVMASLLLWLIPTNSAHLLARLKLTGVAIALAIGGLIALKLIPFPSAL
jgi:hypothetical protein